MKKSSILVAFALVLLSAGAKAQEIAIGIKAGPNFAKLDANSSLATNYSSRTGWHAGAFVLFRGERLGFQPELIFSQQGSKFDYSGTPDLKSNFSYINIPLIVKLYTIAGLNLQVGPQIGFLTKAEWETPTGTEDVKNDLKSTDFSLGLGVGWDLPFGLSIDARYNLGLSDNYDGSTASGAPVSSLKNQVIQVSAGFKLFKFGNAK
ncbi:MAG TPA: porin family protein [Chryseolinea sp.]|nr:porin family protein [Chryseolinea sp.]